MMYMDAAGPETKKMPIFAIECVKSYTFNFFQTSDIELKTNFKSTKLNYGSGGARNQMHISPSNFFHLFGNSANSCLPPLKCQTINNATFPHFFFFFWKKQWISSLDKTMNLNLQDDETYAWEILKTLSNGQNWESFLDVIGVPALKTEGGSVFFTNFPRKICRDFWFRCDSQLFLR